MIHFCIATFEEFSTINNFQSSLHKKSGWDGSLSSAALCVSLRSLR